MISQTLEHTLSLAVRIAQKMGHEYVCVEHVLFALLQNPDARRVLDACAFSIALASQDLQNFFKNRLQADILPEGVAPQPSLGFQRILQIAAQQVISAGKEKIYGDTLLIAIFSERHSHAVHYLSKQNLSRFDVVNFVAHGIRKNELSSSELGEKDELARPTPLEEGNDPLHQGGNDESKSFRRSEAQERSSNDPLALYTIDLCARARQGKIDPLIGRNLEINRAMHILCRRRKNNPLFVGESGVGKTALAEGLALCIVQNKVPEKLRGTKIYSLDLTSLLAGTKFRGDFEQRMKALLSRLKQHPKAILFIDEIHTMIGAGAVSGNSLDASNIIKPALASGELRCIGSTTFKEFRQHIENEHALARRFQRIDINEPSVDESIAILNGLKKNYEEFHGVRYTSEAIRGAVELAKHHMRSHRLPDVAIDIIDEAGAEKSLHVSEEGAKIERKIQLNDIKNTIAKMAQFPSERLTSSDRDSLANLGSQLRNLVFGQDQAVEILERTIRISRSGLGRPDKPIGNFLFSGPTGVGKTELARQLAVILGVSFLRFDMSEYMERHAVSRLIGAPPGYVGYDSGGLLTDGIKKNPYSILLLDEIEKAHPDVHNILLQIMDHGTLTDANGRATDFRNVIIIMTTNVGAKELSQARIGFTKEVEALGQSNRAIKQAFSPEFRNRLDGIISFNPLAPGVMLSIVDKFLAEISKQIAKRQVRWEISSEARQFLARKGYDPHYGARPLARLIEEQIKTPLANILLFAKLPRYGLIFISWDAANDCLVVKSEAAATEQVVSEVLSSEPTLALF